jgi:hypothetical protein
MVFSYVAIGLLLTLPIVILFLLGLAVHIWIHREEKRS